jgi:hypothetical protein
MPNLEEHCRRTMKSYGVEGRDIYSWLDEPSREYASSHREFRHDSDTVRLVGELFGKTYGNSLAENIALDHIMVDHEEEIRKRKPESTNVTNNNEISCIYCEASLKPSDQICPKCGASRTSTIEQNIRANELDKLRLQKEKKELKEELKLELSYREKTPLQRMYDLNYYKNFQNQNPRFRRMHDKNIMILDRLIKEDIKNDPELGRKLKDALEVQARIRQQRVNKMNEKRTIAFLALLCSALFLGIYMHPLVGILTFVFGIVFVMLIH